MSSLFSDPPFSRGTTLLAREPVEYYPPGVTYSQTNDSGAQYPAAGSEVVGQVKVFQDVNPSNGTRFSNELVYCIAARYKPSTAANLTAGRGKAVKLSISQYGGTAEFDENLATATNVNTGERVAFIDEYLSNETAIRPDDIVWLVVKGPVSAKKTEHASTAGISAGAVVAMSGTAGSVFAKTADSIITTSSNEPSLVGLGLCWGDVADDLSEAAFGVAAGSADKFARVCLWGQNWNV
jgi:hypothetical protein